MKTELCHFLFKKIMEQFAWIGGKNHHSKFLWCSFVFNSKLDVVQTNVMTKMLLAIVDKKHF